MKQYTVKDLMVPISEYASVPEGSTVLEAVAALEKAQEDFDHTRYKHRAVLILNKDGQVVGKLNQFGFLRSLDPIDGEDIPLPDIGRFGFSARAMAMHREQNRLKEDMLEQVFQDAGNMRVESFMQTPSENEYVGAETSLYTAIHQMMTGPHLSLLVLEGEEVTGILRLSDVFAAVFHTIKETAKTE
jgi:CBS domain containing-hemolysin-like protein